MQFVKNDNIFIKKDDVFTIDLPGNDLVFTRYLYIKDEVRIALLVSILNKSDDSIFWAYELYYSGFKHELFNLIWKIYYDFFATINPTFEAYLFKKHKEWILKNGENDPTQDCIVSSIIQNLLFRPFNCDIFIMRNLCENFEVEITYDCSKITNIITATQNINQWILLEDFRSISQWILNVNKGLINVLDIYTIFLDTFENELKLTKAKLIKDFMFVIKLNISPNIILLTKIMILFSKKHNLKKGKSIYIGVEPSDIISYETISNIRHYNILEDAYICSIDRLKHLSLFKLKRSKYNIKEQYLNNWEYHASFSPLWSKRIRQFGGYPNYMKQKIIFKDVPDDELMQEFYYLYGLEPDEQTLETQNKSIQTIEKIHNWKWFNLKYKKNGIFEVYDEELDEFDNDGLEY